MSTKYFQRFEKLYYQFGDETAYNIMQNLTQYVDLIDQIKPQVAFYEDYTIKSGDRPDTLSQQLYGDMNYYWTFYLLNDHLRESGWPLQNEMVLDQAKEYYPHRVVTSKTDLATATGGYDFKVGRHVIGQTSGTVGTILKRNLDLGQLVIDTSTAFTEDDTDFNLEVNSNGAATLTLSNPLQKFAKTDLWVLTKTNTDTSEVTVLNGFDITLHSIDTRAEIRNIPFEIGNFTYSITTKVQTFNSTEQTFLEGENIYFRDATTGLVVFADVHKESAQYNAVHHYENASGEWVDIDPFTQVIGANLVPITYLERITAKNNELKQIKVLKSSAVDTVVKEFYRLMNER